MVTAQLFEKLKTPFEQDEIKWRIARAGITKQSQTLWARALPYIDARAVMDRLDEVVGPDKWWDEFKPGVNGGVLCGLSLEIDGKVITRWDGAENTDIEAVKGGLSDAFKRAAVKFGVGRYLYNASELRVDDLQVEQPTDRHNWRFAQIKKQQLEFYWKPPKLSIAFLPPGESNAPPNGHANGRAAYRNGHHAATR